MDFGLEGLAPAKTIGARDGLHSDVGADPLIDGTDNDQIVDGDWAISSGDWSNNNDWA